MNEFIGMGLITSSLLAGVATFTFPAWDKIEQLEAEKKMITVQLNEAQVEITVLEQRLQDQLLMNRN